MNCVQARSLLSPYLDGVVTGGQMLKLNQHLKVCCKCNREYELLRQTQQLLATMARRKAPDDLALKLRLAISREVARSREPFLHGLWIRLENAIQGFMVPATAGLASAVVMFVFLMGFLALPLRAGSDVPIVLNTAPQLEHSEFGNSLTEIKDDSVVIEAYVDSNGRVQDYRVLSDPQQPKDLPTQLKNVLIFTTFRPATFMGRPTAGTAILSFSKISVKG
ncbi:MAG TPA: zf-HC2 domain-containing protein [Terriglobales bacterium]|nr:zf-HC2 domain-containing protein [Terriglobales bacterium]